MSICCYHRVSYLIPVILKRYIVASVTLQYFTVYQQFSRFLINILKKVIRLIAIFNQNLPLYKILLFHNHKNQYQYTYRYVLIIFLLYFHNVVNF